MSRVGAPRLRPRRPYVCVGCWVCWGGLRLLRVAWEGFVCGFWAGLGVLWCWLGGALGWLGAGFGVAVACVVIPCLRSYACWAGLGVLWCWLGAGLGSVGGIATIGAALRRVAGVSGVYGCKTPRVVARKGQRHVLFRWQCWSCSTSLSICRGGVACFRWWLGGNYYHRRCVAACRRRVGGLWLQNPPWLLGRASVACSLGGCVGRVRHVFVCLLWWCGLCSLVAWGELLP